MPETTEDIASLVEQSKELAGNVCDQAVAGVKTADKAIRTRPYMAIGVAVGVGALIGFLLSRPSDDE